MAFDKNLDKEIWSESIDLGNTKVTVAVMSYNDGQAKLQISRENFQGGEFKFAKLGRLTKQELDSILPLVEKAKEHM